MMLLCLMCAVEEGGDVLRFRSSIVHGDELFHLITSTVLLKILYGFWRKQNIINHDNPWEIYTQKVVSLY